MQISKRLEEVSKLVTSGYSLADIGTDHGYIPITLVKEKRIPHAIAMDINEGPLSRAEAHIRQHGLEGKIETRLSDGLHALRQGEAESVLIAGMGGLLIVRILEEGKAALTGCKELILQPQSEIRSVREYLEKEHYKITHENLVYEEGKYYPMMRAVPQNLPELELRHELELRYGPLLLEKKHPLMDKYLEREMTLNRKVLEALKGKNTEAAVKRRWEIVRELELLRKARELCRK